MLRWDRLERVVAVAILGLSIGVFVALASTMLRSRAHEVAPYAPRYCAVAGYFLPCAQVDPLVMPL